MRCFELFTQENSLQNNIADNAYGPLICELLPLKDLLRSRQFLKDATEN